MTKNELIVTASISFMSSIIENKALSDYAVGIDCLDDDILPEKSIATLAVEYAEALAVKLNKYLVDGNLR
jgi:hypothetical protein